MCVRYMCEALVRHVCEAIQALDILVGRVCGKLQDLNWAVRSWVGGGGVSLGASHKDSLLVL